MPRHVVKTRIQNEQRVYEQTRDYMYVDETDSPQDSFSARLRAYLFISTCERRAARQIRPMVHLGGWSQRVDLTARDKQTTGILLTYL